jgi:hypothetical protein
MAFFSHSLSFFRRATWRADSAITPGRCRRIYIDLFFRGVRPQGKNAANRARPHEAARWPAHVRKDPARPRSRPSRWRRRCRRLSSLSRTGLPHHPLDTKEASPGMPPRGMAGQSAAGNSEQPFGEPAAQPFKPGALLGQPFPPLARAAASPTAPATFWCRTLSLSCPRRKLRSDGRALSDVKDPDAPRAVEFMRRKGEQIHPPAGDVHRDVPTACTASV